MYYHDNEDEKNMNEEELPVDREKTEEPTAEDEEKVAEETADQTADETPAEEPVSDGFAAEEESVESSTSEQYAYPPTPASPEKPKKKKGVFVSGAAIAILIVCAIVFVGVMGIGAWKITEYANAATGTEATQEPTSPSSTNSGSSTTPQNTQQSTTISPSGDASMSGAAISPESTVTSNTATVETSLIEKCYRASVVINIYLGDRLSGNGSGVIYTTDGYIITNFHVVEEVASGNRRAVVVLYDGSQYEATYVLGDMDRDIAVIKINKNDCDTVTIGNSDASVLGEKVYAIGNPNGNGLTITDGILSAKDHTTYVTSSYITIKNEDVFLVTAAINAGNSGGGVFNAKGELIGIVNSKTYFDKIGNVVEGEGMVIPIARAVECINTLIENDGYIPGRAKLGVTVNINGKMLSSGWTSTVYYTCVTKVTENTGAEAVGIKVGDIITAVGGINLQQFKSQNNLLSDYDALHMILLNYKAGDSTTVTVLRPESTTSSAGGYQTVSYTEITFDFTFIDYNYSK